MAHNQIKILPDLLPQLASIREAECIGCTKCIQACPVDAIMGAAKQMHTVLKTECIGCGLCVAPCPVDCIDLIPLDPLSLKEEEKKYQHAYNCFEKRNIRIQQGTLKKTEHTILNERKVAAISTDEIKAAISRVMDRKCQTK